MTALASVHPVRAILGRYGTVFRTAWAARRDLAGPSRLADEAAFLPAALSLQATPAHPAPRRVAWAICLLFLAALAWATLGQIDIVAVAPGRLVVSDRSKTVQPLETSVVKRVLVKDGDAVRAEQVLVELDATIASADRTSVREQLANADSETRRSAALAAGLRSGVRPTPTRHADDTSAMSAQLDAEWDELTARLAKFGAEQARRHAEVATVRELIAKLQATLPIARQREDDFRSLLDQGFISSHASQDRTRERIEQERDLATQNARLVEAHASLRETERNRAAFISETQRQLSDRHAQASLKREQLAQELAKTEQRSRLTQLVAPVDGTVQQLAIHTEGGVVTPAQALMVIVPKGAEMTAEVVVDNKDIGFVNPGDPARVKLETFPFTRYGTIDAHVKSVTADAVSDEKRGAIFPARLELARSTIDVDGRRVHLGPGMNVTAEIKTGRRRVIDYLLSPVQQALHDSLRER